jgi:deoxyribonuclease V
VTEQLHPWNVTRVQAAEIQRQLSRQVSLKDDFGTIRLVCGIGLALDAKIDQQVVAGCVFSFPELRMLESRVLKKEISFPYQSGYLVFAVGPAVLELLRTLKVSDLLILPGRGVVHPRHLGLASHLGIWLNLPTIACARRPIFADYRMPKESRGSFAYFPGRLAHLGVVLRSKSKARPIFVTPGHKISLGSAIEFVLKCCTEYRLPEPLRMAAILARKG